MKVTVYGSYPVGVDKTDELAVDSVELEASSPEAAAQAWKQLEKMFQKEEK